MSREDWEKMAANAKNTYMQILDLSLSCSDKFGKTHPTTKKVERLYERMKDLKSDMDDLAYEYAQGLFNEKEISHLFYGD